MDLNLEGTADDENCLVLVYTFDEWCYYLEHSISKSKRKSFLAEFTHSLSKKLQDAGIPCFLTHRSNYLNFRQNNETYWSGFYNCNNEICHAEFRTTVFSKPFMNCDIKIIVRCNKPIVQHEVNKSSYRCTGEKRQLLKLKLLSYGTVNVQNENIIANTKDPNESRPTNVKYLRAVKHEARHEKQLCTDLIVDTRASKRILDRICLVDARKDSLIGYIRFSMDDPFGFILMSQIQVDMWSVIQNYNPVWNIDSTGKVLKNVNRQKPPFFYSISVHDNKNNSIIQVAEFVTTSHTTQSIATFLSQIKFNLTKSMKSSVKFKLAPILVMDFSYALIGASLKEFNNCSITTYLNWCFDIIFPSQFVEHNILQKAMNTRIYLCCAHFIKLIVKHINQVKNATNNSKKAFIFAFTLLQNSTSIDEFDSFLKHIYIIFNSKYMNKSVLYSLSYISRALALRQVQIIDFDTSQETNNKQEESNFVFCEDETENSIKNNSKFSLYYLKTKLPQLSQITNNIDTDTLNLYYNSKFLEIISENYFHLVPLWSGIIIGDWYNNNRDYTKRTRLTNNVVEGWFNILKNNLLGKHTVSPSELSSVLYERLEAKFYQFYYKIEENIFKEPKHTTKNQGEGKVLKKIETKIIQKQEVWKKNCTLKRSKGIYYSKYKHFESLTEDFNHNDCEMILDDQEIMKTFGLDSNIEMQDFNESELYTHDELLKKDDIIKTLNNLNQKLNLQKKRRKDFEDSLGSTVVSHNFDESIIKTEGKKRNLKQLNDTNNVNTDHNELEKRENVLVLKEKEMEDKCIKLRKVEEELRILEKLLSSNEVALKIREETVVSKEKESFIRENEVKKKEDYLISREQFLSKNELNLKKRVEEKENNKIETNNEHARIELHLNVRENLLATKEKEIEDNCSKFRKLEEELKKREETLKLKENEFNSLNIDSFMILLKKRFNGYFDENDFLKNQQKFTEVAFQLSKLKHFGLVEDKYVCHRVSSKLNQCFLNYYKPKVTSPDGSCLYSMISIGLIGNESLVVILRMLTCFTLYQFRDLFEKWIYDDNNNSNFINVVKDVWSSNSWGDQWSLIAISTFLNKNICIYSIFANKHMNESELQDAFLARDRNIEIGCHLIYKPFSNHVFIHGKNKDEYLFGFFDAACSHYSAIVPVANDVPLFIPYTDAFFMFTQSKNQLKHSNK